VHLLLISSPRGLDELVCVARDTVVGGMAWVEQGDDERPSRVTEVARPSLRRFLGEVTKLGSALVAFVRRLSLVHSIWEK
jgi:hypothetical protein